MLTVAGAVVALIVVLSIIGSLARGSTQGSDVTADAPTPVVSASRSPGMTAAATSTATATSEPTPTLSEPSSATPSPRPSSTPEVEGQDQLRLRDIYHDGVDVDSLPLTVRSALNSDFDVNAGGMIHADRLALWSGTEDPSLAQCANLLRTQSRHQLQNRSGLRFCVQSSEGRVAAAYVLAYGGAISQIQVRVWTRTPDG